MSTLTLPRESKVGHAAQRVGMIGSELRLASLHHLHLQLLGLVSPALVPVRRRQVGHAGQRRGMVGPELRLARLRHLHLQLLCLFPESSVLKY
jgi:hypothetical protein